MYCAWWYSSTRTSLVTLIDLRALTTVSFVVVQGDLNARYDFEVQRFLTSEDGPTAVEYAVMLALILVACITIVTTLGTSVSTSFNKVNTSLGTINGS